MVPRHEEGLLCSGRKGRLVGSFGVPANQSCTLIVQVRYAKCKQVRLEMQDIKSYGINLSGIQFNKSVP